MGVAEVGQEGWGAAADTSTVHEGRSLRDVHGIVGVHQFGRLVVEQKQLVAHQGGFPGLKPQHFSRLHGGATSLTSMISLLPRCCRLAASVIQLYAAPSSAGAMYEVGSMTC